MTTQNIISLFLILILVVILIYRIKTVKQNDERIEKSSLMVIFFATFSIAATRIKPTNLDVIAVYVILILVNFFVLIYSTITDFTVRGPRKQMQLTQEEDPEIILSNPMAEEIFLPQATVRSVDISPTGEYTVHDQHVAVIQPTEFQIPISNLTTKNIVFQLLKPDLMELFLLFSALFLNWAIMTRITGLDLFHPFMLMYWGILSFILYTIRWSYTGPFQYAARMKVIEQQMMEGKHVVDFKVIGMLFSFILVVVGIILVIQE
ncbi:MAG: hypothetical protein GPJ54_08025 [Candidatus Heimdallarchaeota archaeon]|nr:hypothetical protein [Candidatus Heimdallarchaeota archaeon]